MACWHLSESRDGCVHWLRSLAAPPFFPFAMSHRARELGPIALRALQRNRVFVYINSSMVLSIESIVFSHTELLQLQDDSTRAPIAVPTFIH